MPLVTHAVLAAVAINVACAAVAIGAEVDDLIAELQAKIDDCDVALAKFPPPQKRVVNGIEFEEFVYANPRAAELAKERNELDSAQRRLKDFQRNRKAVLRGLANMGTAAAKQWWVKQTREKVRGTADEVLRADAELLTDKYATAEMRKAFVDAYVQECRRFASGDAGEGSAVAAYRAGLTKGRETAQRMKWDKVRVPDGNVKRAIAKAMETEGYSAEEAAEFSRGFMEGADAVRRK